MDPHRMQRAESPYLSLEASALSKSQTSRSRFECRPGAPLVDQFAFEQGDLGVQPVPRDNWSPATLQRGPRRAPGSDRRMSGTRNHRPDRSGEQARSGHHIRSRPPCRGFSKPKTLPLNVRDAQPRWARETIQETKLLRSELSVSNFDTQGGSISPEAPGSPRLHFAGAW